MAGDMAAGVFGGEDGISARAHIVKEAGLAEISKVGEAIQGKVPAGWERSRNDIKGGMWRRG